MTTEMVLKIPTEKLSTFKKNKIEAEINDIPVGYVTKIIREIQKGIFNCEVLIYSNKENLVYQAMQKHFDTMKGK